MPQRLTTTFIDREAGLLYYLAFDQMLACAPVREGVAYVGDARVVPAMPGDSAATARRASIRAALLRAEVGNSPAWAAVIQEASDFAARLATEAGFPGNLSVPGRVVNLALGRETTLPPTNATPRLKSVGAGLSRRNSRRAIRPLSGAAASQRSAC